MPSSEVSPPADIYLEGIKVRNPTSAYWISTVGNFIRAVNAFDTEALLELFHDDAMVNDQLREFWGKAAIRDWATREIIGDRVRISVTDVMEHFDHVIVRAKVDGEYDKRGLPEPLELSFHFFVSDDRIAQLLILYNQPAA